MKKTIQKKKKELLATQITDLVSATNENLLRVNLSKFFTDLEHEIQSALIEYWTDNGLLQGQTQLITAPIHEKHKEYYELLLSHTIDEFNRGADIGARLVERATENVSLKSTSVKKVPVTFTANRNNLFGTKKFTQNRLEKDTFVASEYTMQRLDEEINTILGEGYKSGLGINHVSQQITNRFDQLRTWEASRIARTEIHTAQNMGIMKSYEEMGVGYTQWNSAKHQPSRTRPSHLRLNGEIIELGGTYSNGLSYPGDKSGRIEEWINCRCSNAPFIMPPGMSAPPFSPFTVSDLANYHI